MTWHLDLDFPGSNACGAAITCVDGAPAISLTPDPKDSPEALWFRFRLRRLEPEAPAPWLVLRHVGTLLGGGDGSALQPVARCDGGAWLRLPPGQPCWHADGRCAVRWPLPAAAACLEVAFCFPYGQDELDALIAATGMRVQAVGASERGRPLLRLDNGPGVQGSPRRGLFVLARQHSGETPGSWVMDGMLRRIAELGDAAPLTWVVPFGDPDGVLSGCYGKDRHPVDFNRAWPGIDSLPRRHEVMCWMHEIARWRTRCTPTLLLDLHAPGGHERTGVYAFTPSGADGTVPATVEAWAARLQLALGAPWSAAQDFARVGRYPSRWTREAHLTGSRWAVEQGLPALTVETSYQGQGERAFSTEDYQTIGMRLADGVASPG